MGRPLKCSHGDSGVHRSHVPRMYTFHMAKSKVISESDPVGRLYNNLFFAGLTFIDNLLREESEISVADLFGL